MALAILQACGFPVAIGDLIANTHGINDAEALSLLSDDDITTLCKQLRKGNGISGSLGEHPVAISMLLESKFKLAAYCCRFLLNCGDVPDNMNVTNAIVNGVFKHYVESVRKHDDPEVPEFSKKDWQQNFEVLDNWLHGCRGDSSKLPLLYVIRDDTERSAEAMNTFSDHDAALSAKAEIVHNAGPPIVYSDQFRMDNQKVFNLMVEAFGSDAHAMSHMK